MGPWLVHVSPCVWENIVATCKIGSFLCTLGNLLQKNVIVLFFFFFFFFFWKKISKWRSFEKKRLFLTYFSHFFSHQGKVFCSPYGLFGLTNFEKKYEFIRYGFSLVWVLVLILIRAILEQSIKLITKWWAKYKLECLQLVCTYTNAEFIGICKLGLWMTEVKIQYKSQKAPLLSSSHFAFYR